MQKFYIISDDWQDEGFRARKNLGSGLPIKHDLLVHEREHVAGAVRFAAGQLGFSDCRIARSERSRHESSFLSWIDRGRHAGMAWLANEPSRRCDPGRVLEGCRSVIVLSYEYGRDWGASLSRCIARYAWGDDYHPIIESKLADLNELLSGYGGMQRYYVDTGPVLERDFAAASGLGWRGKSGLIVREHRGTTCFLAVILTDLELPADQPARNRCGTCRRCVDHCPTGALGEDGQIDCARCVSYLTIEHRGSIPEQVRPLIGSRIYGCDSCQDCCPWNRRPERSSDARFDASARLRDMPLAGFLALSEQGFAELFRHSPVRRIKRERFLRNVCVALGNVGETKDIDCLRVVANESELLKEHAQWAICRIEGRKRGNEEEAEEK